MIHHKYHILSYNSIKKKKPYGVSSSYKVLSKGLLLKKWGLVVRCLKEVLHLSTKQVDVVLALLRLQAYYPRVYPKASQIAEAEYVGKATVWRTVNNLQDMNLLEVVNQFVLRPEAQTSNLYLLNNLIILIARYLAEHGVQFYEKWLKPYLQLPGSVFWGTWASCQGSRAAPS